MINRYSGIGRGAQRVCVQLADEPSQARTVGAGLLVGLVGALTIWVYEPVVWVGVQHLLSMAGSPRNATGLVFGRDVQGSLGAAAYVVGTGMYFIFTFVLGVLFAALWPVFRRRGYEAKLMALFYAAVPLALVVKRRLAAGAGG